MKIVIFAAALTLGSAALAQTGNTVSDPSLSSGPRGVTQQGTDPEGQPCTPPGFNAGATAYPPCEAGTAAGAEGPGHGGSNVRCSRTVTDRCIQAYERGVRR